METVNPVVGVTYIMTKNGLACLRFDTVKIFRVRGNKIYADLVTSERILLGAYENEQEASIKLADLVYTVDPLPFGDEQPLVYYM